MVFVVVAVVVYILSSKKHHLNRNLYYAYLLQKGVHMDKELMLLQGKRLKEIRKIMGKTQASFADWLNKIGITGNYGEPYKDRTIASWETGRRALPNTVKKAIAENITLSNGYIQYAYLDGKSDNITQTDFDKINTADHIKEISDTVKNKRIQILSAYNIDIHFMNWILCQKDFIDKFNFEYNKDWPTDNFAKIAFGGGSNKELTTERVKYDHLYSSWIENGYYDIYPFSDSTQKIRFILLLDTSLSDIGFLAFTHNDLLRIKEIQDKTTEHIILLNIKSLMDSGKI